MARKKQHKVQPGPPKWEKIELEGAKDSLEGRKEREHKLLESVGYRKVKIEDLEAQELERKADEFLANADRDTLAAILENVQALREGMETLKLPSNDPAYLERLQASVRLRDEIAARLTQVDLVPDGGKVYIGVGSFLPHVAEELGRQLATHFETKLRKHD